MAIPLAQGLELGIEGVRTKYKSESVDDIVTIDPQQLSVMGRLSVRSD